jgi:flagellar FliJ protein
MKFRYSFQQIVNLKNNEKTQAEWVLSEAIGRLRSEETSLFQLSEQKSELHNQISSTSAGCTTISNMLLLQSYMDHLDQQILKKHEEIQVAQHDEKVWTKAREKAYNQFKVLAGRKEQQALDEITTNRFKRLS